MNDPLASQRPHLPDRSPGTPASGRGNPPGRERASGGEDSPASPCPAGLAYGPARSLYVHVPFCRRRCGYCDFAVVVGREELEPQLLAAYQQEASWTCPDQPLETIYLGGGTPSRMSPAGMEHLLQQIRRRFELAPAVEWTVEANPEDVTPEWLRLLRDYGVTRISLGVQSFQREKLRRLDREHEPEQIRRAIERVLRAGLVLSLDLIFASPGETLRQWQADLDQVLASGAQHVSLYGLTIERGTRFWSLRRRGRLAEVPEQQQAEMYLAAIDRLSQAGWEHYEVSNFARPGFRCRHNLGYWHCRDYHAWGPGAARHYQGVRQTNHPSTTTYLRRVLAGRSPVWQSERLDPEQRMREALVLALRTLEGVSPEEFAYRWGRSPWQLAGEALGRYLEEGYLVEQQGRLRLSRRGLLVSDSLWGALLGG